MTTMINQTIIDFQSTSQRVLFTAADYTIFILLIVVSIGIGIYVGFTGWSSTSTKDFLVRGRKMHSFPVALSLIGGIISSLSVLGIPTESYKYGIQLSLSLVGTFWGTLFVVFLIIPTLYPLDLISMMEYMILRFNSKFLKKAGSIVQIINAFIYLGLVLYAPSLALMSVTTLSSSSSIVLLGVVCVIYISLGGVKAVIYTDVIQTSVMFFGVAAVISVVCTDIGGVAKVFEIAEKGERLEIFNFDMSLTTRHTFWNVQILGLYLIIDIVGINQSQFQRLTSVSSLKIAQWLCVVFYFGMCILWLLFYFTGLVAYATYVDCDPLKCGHIEKADQIIPFMVADKLSHLPGMSGLFVAAVYGAVLSTVSSSASSVAALLWEDFLSDWNWFKKTVKISPIMATRCLSGIAGLIGIALAFIVGQIGGTTLIQICFSILGGVSSPLDGLFLSAILAPWVTEKGAICGFIACISFNAWVVTGKLVNGGGAAVELPSSVAGCPSGLVANLSSNVVNFEQEFSTINPALIYNQESPESDYLALYDLSYCYYGIFGILIVFIVSSVVSIVTGPTDPYDIDERLVNRYALLFYRKLWDRFSSSKNITITSATNMNSSPPKRSIVDNGGSINQSFEMN